MKQRDQRHPEPGAPGRARARRDRHAERFRRRVERGADRTDRMLVATETFETEYDGDRVAITAGRDHIRATHPIARVHRDRFSPADQRVAVVERVR